MQPFSPSGPAVKQTVTSAGVLVALSPWVDQAHGGSLNVSVRGSAPVFIAWGGAGVTCTEATGHHCIAGQANLWGVPVSATHVYLIAEAGQTSDVQISQGRGL
jgi:hypothetical protein